MPSEPVNKEPETNDGKFLRRPVDKTLDRRIMTVVRRAIGSVWFDDRSWLPRCQSSLSRETFRGFSLRLVCRFIVRALRKRSHALDTPTLPHHQPRPLPPHVQGRASGMVVRCGSSISVSPTLPWMLSQKPTGRSRSSALAALPRASSRTSRRLAIPFTRSRSSGRTMTERNSRRPTASLATISP